MNIHENKQGQFMRINMRLKKSEYIVYVVSSLLFLIKKQILKVVTNTVTVILIPGDDQKWLQDLKLILQ